ncbi:MAG: zinc metallopeptidase [Clostridiales bacterium]|nr:zinc metallopeptidase [Clostridiales bacterium]
MTVLTYSYYSSRGLSESPGMLLLLAAIAIMIVGMIAQARVTSTFQKYSGLRCSSGMSASEIARRLLEMNGSNVRVRQISGSLTDNFSPKAGCVSLSEAVYSSQSVAAIAVAAHECGHVMQYEEGWAAIKFRNFLLPAANFGSRFSYILVIGGLFLGAFGYYVSLVGVVLFGFALVFQLVTLPVELDASRRALDMLASAGFITRGEEESAARKVLRAAAFTYLVAALSAAVSFLRLLSIANSGRRR